MFRMKKIGALLVIPFIALFVSTTVQAAGNGSTPSGKPFIELDGQIIEIEGEIRTIKDQIDSIVGRVDSIEERVAADEDAIAALQVLNASLQAQIEANATDIDSIETEVAALEAENMDLQAQIDAHGDATGALQTLIDDNSALITSLEESLGVMGTSLQDQIDNNIVLITFLQEDIESINESLATKQTILDGNCPDGQFLRGINADGSVVCGIDETGVVGPYISRTHVWRAVHIWPNKTFGFYINCPPGYIATSAGYRSLNIHQPSQDVIIEHSRAFISFRWWTINSNHWPVLQVTCIRLLP